MSASEDELAKASPFAKLVGARLRAIRQQKNLSLNEVEQQSAVEFKASVLGAYERGERSISVPRLERLARFYGVTVDQLLPRESQRVEDNQAGTAAPTKLRIDVAKLSLREGEKFKMLERRAIAVMLDVAVDDVGTKLGELDLLFVPPNS